MNRVAIALFSSLILSAGVLVACSSDDSNSSGFALGGGGSNAGSAGSGNAGEAGEAGAAGENNNAEGGSAGENGEAGSNPFGGGGESGNAGTAGSAGSGTATCDVPLGGECGSCASNSCCDSWDACASNADCTSFMSCFLNCQDEACANACQAQNPTGAQAFQPFVSCLSNSCESECFEDGDGSGQITCEQVKLGSASCTTCMQGGCCSEMESCFNDQACLTLNNCLAGCQGNEACQQGCGSKADQATIAKFNAISQCAQSTCGSACGGLAERSSCGMS